MTQWGWAAQHPSPREANAVALQKAVPEKPDVSSSANLSGDGQGRQ